MHFSIRKLETIYGFTVINFDFKSIKVNYSAFFTHDLWTWTNWWAEAVLVGRASWRGTCALIAAFTAAFFDIVRVLKVRWMTIARQSETTQIKMIPTGCAATNDEAEQIATPILERTLVKPLERFEYRGWKRRIFTTSILLDTWVCTYRIVWITL